MCFAELFAIISEKPVFSKHFLKGISMKKIKRILALAGVILLIGLYGATIYCALTDNSGSMAWFKASILTTIMVPVLLWTYTFVYRMVRGSQEDIFHEDPEDAFRQNSGEEALRQDSEVEAIHQASEEKSPSRNPEEKSVSRNSDKKGKKHKKNSHHK